MLAIVEGFLRKGVDGLRLDIFNAMYQGRGLSGQSAVAAPPPK
jgi:hypothetical protein